MVNFVTIPILKTFEQLKELRSSLAAPLRLGFVPTMGALHAGHLSLVETALKHSDHVLVSIFVNPSQFGKGEDLAQYPRQIEKDVSLLASVGAHGVYAPCTEDIYPEGFQTWVYNSLMAKGLCGHCLLYTSPSPQDLSTSRMPSSA